jgi:hypothetical protein
MIHCVTQQQPIHLNSVGIQEINVGNKELIGIFDVLGRPTKQELNSLQIYLYSDGNTEKIFKVE